MVTVPTPTSLYWDLIWAGRMREVTHGLTLRVKDHGIGLCPIPASFFTKVQKLVYLRVRESAHGLTLCVKDCSTSEAVLERGEACFSPRKNGAPGAEVRKA